MNADFPKLASSLELFKKRCGNNLHFLNRFEDFHDFSTFCRTAYGFDKFDNGTSARFLFIKFNFADFLHKRLRQDYIGSGKSHSIFAPLKKLKPMAENGAIPPSEKRLSQKASGRDSTTCG
jgi:hypothetical protein